jgi:hypothetical protein
MFCRSLPIRKRSKSQTIRQFSEMNIPFVDCTGITQTTFLAIAYNTMQPFDPLDKNYQITRKKDAIFLQTACHSLRREIFIEGKAFDIDVLTYPIVKSQGYDSHSQISLSSIVQDIKDGKRTISLL